MGNFTSCTSTSVVESSHSTKNLYCIRHAESEANKARKSSSTWLSSDFWDSGFDAGICDPSVSNKGYLQIQKLHRKMVKHDFLKAANIELIITSPLTRTIETAIGLQSYSSTNINSYRNKSNINTNNISDKNTLSQKNTETKANAIIIDDKLVDICEEEEVKDIEDDWQTIESEILPKNDIPIIAHSDLRPIFKSKSAQGSITKSNLKAKYNGILNVDHIVGEEWWNPKKKQKQQTFMNDMNNEQKNDIDGDLEDDISQFYETQAEFLVRVQRFKKFLASRNEKNIVLVGHCGYIRTFLSKWGYVRNCQIVKAQMTDTTITNVESISAKYFRNK